MARRVVLTIGLLAVMNALLICAPSRAQVQVVPQGCSSPSVPNEQLRANADEKVENADGKDDASRKVIVERIEFDRPVHLSNSDVEQVIKTANESEWDADSLGWVDELAEIFLRGAWQDQGYFKIDLTARALSIGGDSNHERFLVAVHVINEGPQFHLGDIQFTGGTAITEAELRQAFPLREGEFFNVARVREGLVVLTKLYGSLGYIDFTAVPETEIDENLQRISLVMRLDEQKQFRIGAVEIRGLDPSLEARLRSIIVPGEIVNMDPITAFLKENRSAQPPRGLDNLGMRRDVRTGIVDVTFDPRSCRDPE
jgi:hypothetical protein